jgi:hypothetical protein
MDDQKTIIALLCVIIAILVVGVVMFSPLTAKEDSKLAIADNSLDTGESLVVVLTDSRGVFIPNETVNIRVTDDDGVTIDEDVTTDSKGKAKFSMEESGQYSVECSYGGNAQYASSSTAGNVTVENPTTEVVSQEQTSTSTQTSYPYDINNLPPTNDPYPETTRYYIDEYHIKQEYEDGYMRTVDVRTGEIHSLGFK